MSTLKTNIIFWLSVTYYALFALLFWLVGYDATAYVMAALIFGLAMMVLLTWGTTALRAFAEGGREGEAVLAFSICLIPAYAVVTRIWQVLRIQNDNPEWMLTSPIGLSAAVLLLIFFTGVLLAPETKGGVVPKKNYIWWAIGIFIAGIFIGATVAITLAKDTSVVTPQNKISPMSMLNCGDPKPILVRAFCRARPQ